MSGSILIIILSRYIDRENYCHVTNKQTNKQTNKCFSVNQDAHNVNEQTIYIFYKKKKKKKKKSQYYGIQLIHIIIFSLEWIGQYKKEINNKITILFYEGLATHVILDLYRWRGHHRPRV